MSGEEKKRPRPGIGFGIGYHEDIDAEEFIAIAEGTTTPQELAEERQLQEDLGGQAKRAIQAGANFASALGEIDKLMGKGKLDSKLASGLKSVASKVENALSMYGREILPKLK